MAGAGSLERNPSRRELEAFFRKQLPLHAHSLGDLDDPYWKSVRSFAWRVDAKDELAAVFLIYDAATPPILLALEDLRPEDGAALLDALLQERAFPRELYAHVSPTLVSRLEATFVIADPVDYWKMGWSRPRRVAVETPAGTQVRKLGSTDLSDLARLYEASYESHWFQAEMLERGAYYGAFEGDVLVAAAGTHILSEALGVALIGNVATLPRCRGRGLATLVTDHLCDELWTRVADVALNVRKDNAAAIRCYEKLGFEARASFVELSLVAR